MRTWQRRSLKAVAALVAATVILLAVLVGIFRLFAPLVPGYRVEVERWAERALERPVSIARMGARWGWYGPEITLEDVKLYSADGKYVVVTAHEIRLGVTPGALLHGEVSAPSRITLIGPQLSVVRDADGHYSLRGFGGENGKWQQMDWHGAVNDVFSQRAEIVVRDGSVTLLDLRQRTAPFVFGDVDLKLDNSADSHTLSGRLHLPEAFGQTLAFRADVEGQAAHPEAWQWHGRIEGEALDMPRLLAYWPQYHSPFARGVLNLRADLSGNGARLLTFRTHVNASDLQPAGPGVRGFSALSGDVDWLRLDDGWRVHGDDILLAQGQTRWPVSHFDLVRRADAQGESWQGEASFLRMQDLDTLLGWLPPALRDRLQSIAAFAPQGDVSDLSGSARWQQGRLATWSVQGMFRDLGVQPAHGFPGFSGMDGAIRLDQDGGSLTLATQHATLTFPELFRWPLQADALDAGFQFNHDAAGWHIASGNIRVRNKDGSARAHGSFLFPADGSSPQLDLEAVVTDGRVRNKSAYFPVGIMPEEVVSWLDSAIVSGQVPRATLSVHGRLADFPYDNGRGLFDIRFRLVNGVLDYAEGWPRLEHLDADVEFRNQGLSATLRGGSVLGDDIAGSTAGFADLRNGVLRVQGAARGRAQASLAFLRDGPLKARFGHYLDHVRADGHSDVSLSLVLPVDKPDQYSLDGSAQLRDVSVSVEGAPGWSLSRLQGKVHFTGSGISADALSGDFLGSPVTITLRPGTDDSTLFDARGGANAARLTAALALPGKDALQGQTAWTARGSIPNDPAARTTGLSLHAESDLAGLGINLPAPFAKPAAQAAPLSLDFAAQADGSLQLGLNLAQHADALLRFRVADNGWRFERGTLTLGGEPADLPDTPGLSVSGKLDSLDTRDWQAYVNDRKPTPDGVPALPDFLQRVDLHIEHFAGFGQHINGLHLLLERQAQDWRLALASAAIGGRIILPFTMDARHPIVADMDHVRWQHEISATGGATAQAQPDPRRIPALRFDSKLLQFDGVTLSDVRAVLTPRPDGVNLADFAATGRTFQAGASGSWTIQPDGAGRSNLTAHITSTEVEQTLKAFGYAPGITGDAASLQADINWAGGPFADILPGLNGQVHLRLTNGQLLEVQPGAGRLFGLLSINALPRRLLLNFSDVFGKGFGYDSIEGNFLLRDGDAYTRDLTISGPAAKIHVLGRIGLAQRDFDEALIVDASVGPTLPILGALAGGVGVGAVVWLLTEVFKKPLTAAGEVRYRLTGTWDNPKLEKVAESPKAPPMPAARTRGAPLAAQPNAGSP